MKSTGARDFQIKRLDFTKEGAALQRAVSDELAWVRRSVMSGRGDFEIKRLDFASVGAALQRAVSDELAWVRRAAMSSRKSDSGATNAGSKKEPLHGRSTK